MNRARHIAIGLIVITAAAIFTVAVMRICATRRPHVELERDLFPVMGIDLSAHNGDVEFDKVAEAGVSFVFLKASEGTTFRAMPVSEQEPTISSDLTVTATTRDAISSTQWIRSISTCRWR